MGGTGGRRISRGVVSAATAALAVHLMAGTALTCDIDGAQQFVS